MKITFKKENGKLYSNNSSKLVSDYIIDSSCLKCALMICYIEGEDVFDQLSNKVLYIYMKENGSYVTKKVLLIRLESGEIKVWSDGDFIEIENGDVIFTEKEHADKEREDKEEQDFLLTTKDFLEDYQEFIGELLNEVNNKLSKY